MVVAVSGCTGYEAECECECERHRTSVLVIGEHYCNDDGRFVFICHGSKGGHLCGTTTKKEKFGKGEKK